MQYSHPFETSMVSSILDVILKITECCCTSSCQMVIHKQYILCQLPNWKPDNTAEVGTWCSLTHLNSQLWSHAASWPLCCHCHICVMFQAMQRLFSKANSWYSVLSPQKLYCRAICMWKSVGQVILRQLVCCDEACKLNFWMHFCKGLKVSGSSSDR